jgi:hypothetical protein
MHKLTQKLAIGAAALAGLALISTSVTFAASMDTSGQNGQTQGDGHHKRGPGMMFGKNVQRSVVNISNGVQVTMTSTDAATVTKLQAFQQPTPPANSNVTVAQTNVSNGVQITMSSTDAATVTKLQSSGGFGRGFGGPRGGKGGRHGARGFGGTKSNLNVQRSVANISNGIQITMTSTDAATVTKLQTVNQRPASLSANSNVTVTRTNISNGVQITMTSTDAATVTRLQQRTLNQNK